MAEFREIKSINLKLKQSEVARELEISSSTLQRYRREINMFSPYTIPTTHIRKQKISNHTEHDLKRTSNDRKNTSKNGNDKFVSKKVKTKNSLRGGDQNNNQTQGRDFIEQAFSST